jgi:hypothetical protein
MGKEKPLILVLAPEFHPVSLWTNLYISLGLIYFHPRNTYLTFGTTDKMVKKIMDLGSKAPNVCII